MLIFCHLFLGIIIGLFIAVLLNDRRAVLFCAFGGVLPDLIDKPLGHIILAESLNNGRIFFHGLLMLLIILVIGILIWKKSGSRDILYIVPGMLSHQLADQMWNLPVNWLYPFLGPFASGPPTTDMGNLFMAEISSVSEWGFFFVIAAVFVVFVLLRGRFDNQNVRLFRLAATAVLIISGLAAIFIWLTSAVPQWAVYGGATCFLFLGVASLSGGFALLLMDKWMDLLLE